MVATMTGRTRTVWTAGLAFVLAFAAIACAGSSSIHAQDGDDATTVVASADEAVRGAVAQLGGVYAGDCAATRSPDDAGKICSKLIDQKGDQRAYLIGRTFSEFSTWTFVQQSTSGWRVTATTPLDFTDMSDAVPWPR